MAQVQYAPHISVIRGSIGNTTYSTNRPGNFMRIRTKPRDPALINQLTHRSRHAAIVDRWRNTLTNDQRIVWNDLALITDFHSPTCRSYHPSGFSLYLRANVFRATLAAAPVDVPDPVAAAGPMTLTLGAGADATRAYITADADWHDGKAGHFHCWGSPIVSQSVYYYRGPWTSKVGYNINVLAAPPVQVGLTPNLAIGDRIFIKFKAFFGGQGTIITFPQHTHWDRTA